MLLVEYSMAKEKPDEALLLFYLFILFKVASPSFATIKIVNFLLAGWTEKPYKKSAT